MDSYDLSRIFKPRDRVEPRIMPQGIRRIAMRSRETSYRRPIPRLHAIDQAHRACVRQKFVQCVLAEGRHDSTVRISCWQSSRSSCTACESAAAIAHSRGSDRAAGLSCRSRSKP